MNNLRIASPCKTTWESMAGDERVRHCTLCSLNVYNFSELTGEEIRALLVRTEGRVCARMYRRADGTVLTRDCPSGLAALRRRMSRAAAAVIAALFSVSAFASGGKSCEKPRFRKHGSKMTLEIEQTATAQQAVFTGVVQVDGSPLPGVTVTLRNEVTKRELTRVTDMNGTFTFANLPDGLYRADVMLEGFKPAVVEHLLLKQSEITRARVVLKMEAVTGEIMLGAVAVEPSDGVSATYSQDLINKLPI